jgi:CMP-N-acetylneuraminic acid synthetase
MTANLNFIIPAKTSSSRVKNKNWREFAFGKSLVDITLDKILDYGADKKNIFISCEDISKEQYCKNRGVNFLLRDKRQCDNDFSVQTLLRNICDQVKDDKDIAYSQVCDPFFDDYKNCLDLWDEVKQKGHDSLVVCHAHKMYLMDSESRPIGWSFGSHHTKSQDLPIFRTMPFTLSALTRDSVKQSGYHVGSNPYWYESSRRNIDIDTEEDFRLAQIIYTELTPERKL